MSSPRPFRVATVLVLAAFAGATPGNVPGQDAGSRARRPDGVVVTGTASAVVRLGGGPAATLRPGSPADASMDAAVVREAAALYEAAVDRGDIRGAVVLVARRGHIVLHEGYGYRDLDGEKPMQASSLFRMASNTKSFTAAAVLKLRDDGKLSVGDRIADHIGAFDNDKGGAITVAQLMSHTSGMRIEPLFFSPLVTKSDRYPGAPCLLAEVDRFGPVGAEVEPGTSYSYNNAAYNTLAGLVEIRSGMGFADYLRRSFYEPLGMRESCNHESVADRARMSAVFATKKDGGFRVVWSPDDEPDFPFVRGSGGMVSTAYDYAIWCQTFLNGGVYGDVRVLSERSVRDATTSKTRHIEGAPGYGFGWAVGKDGTFSHSGSDGTWAFVDPARELIGIGFTQTRAPAPRREFRALLQRACAD